MNKKSTSSKLIGKLPNGHMVEVTAISRDVPAVRPNERHHHDFFEILCISEGETHVTIRDRKIIAGPGDLLIYYPFEEHREFVQPGRFSLIRLCFAIDSLDMHFPEKDKVEPVIQLPWPELFHRLFDQMIVEQQMRDPWSDTMIKLHLTHFVVLLQRALHCGDERGRERTSDTILRIRKTIALIHQSLDTDIRLKDLANEAFMSESHYSHTFKETLGVSPKHYITKAKVLKAQELLEQTNLPVKHIAADLGYDNANYFSKVFAKMTGKSPSAFRQNRRK